MSQHLQGRECVPWEEWNKWQFKWERGKKGRLSAYGVAGTRAGVLRDGASINY